MESFRGRLTKNRVEQSLELPWSVVWPVALHLSVTGLCYGEIVFLTVYLGLTFEMLLLQLLGFVLMAVTGFKN